MSAGGLHLPRVVPSAARWKGAVVVASAILLVSGVAAGVQQTASKSRAHVEYLASDELGGRLTGTPDAAKAADYIVSQLQAVGAQPLPGSDGFRLPFEFTSGITDAGSSLQAFSSSTQRGVRSAAASIRALPRR